MKKVFTLLCLAFSCFTFGQAFTPGNLVVVRIGNGSAVTSGTTAPVFLDEYTTAGVLVQSIAMPVAVVGSNQPFSLTTSSGSEGLITLSPNGQFLAVAGYAAAPGLASASGTTSASTPRVVAVINAAGSVNTTSAFTDFASGSSPRAAVTTNGTDLWFAGGAGGVRYGTLGASTSTQLSTTVTNMRSVMIYNGQLYAGDASGSVTRLGKVGTGLPTTSGQTIVNQNNVSPTYTAANQFYFTTLPGGTNNADGYNTLYIADDGSTPASPGIKKYSWNSTTSLWDSTGIIDPGASNTYRSLTGKTNGTSVTLYTSKASNGIYTVTDASGFGVAPTAIPTLVVAPAANIVFRGVAFTQGTVTFPMSLLSFTGTLNTNNVNFSWSTTNEINVAGFEIERSMNGKDFKSIGTVEAKGSPATNNYSFVDERAVKGVSYYRLRMNDRDGAYRYSQAVIIKTKSEGVNVYPNPVKSEITIQHEAALRGATVAVMDFSGKQVLSVNVEVGAVQTSLNAARLAPGTYMIVYNNDGVRSTRQFIKQ